MITKQVEKVMRGALKSFSKKNDVKCNNIQVMIHTKNEEMFPEYFYLVDGAPKKDDNGEVKVLSFNKDILGTKLDFLNREAITATFLQKYFKETSAKHEIEPKSIYFMISSKDEEAKELYVLLFNESKQVKSLSLKEMFEGEEEPLMNDNDKGSDNE